MQFFFEHFLIRVFVVFASDQQKKLSVGSYLHCAVALEESSDMDVDESEVVTIDVDPETISISVVSCFCLLYI